MYLFFDTETASLPADYNAPATDLENWPRVVQLGWIACESAGRILAREERIIRPEGFRISLAASQIHGITTAHALGVGEPLQPVLDQFAATVAEATVLIGHNIQFDDRVLTAEFLRAGMADVLRGKRQVCTMKESVDFCRLPGRRGYKWPTLTELHRKLFNTAFAGAHGALADCEACMQCYFRLRELGAVEGEEEWKS